MFYEYYAKRNDFDSDFKRRPARTQQGQTKPLCKDWKEYLNGGLSLGVDTMNPEQRVNELRKRQVWYGSSMVVKLSSINGNMWYSIYAWTNNTKFLVTMDKYNGQDPAEMLQVALLELGCKKIKLGVPQ